MKSSETLKYLTPESPADVELYANLQMGLHAAAQPLTLLRGVLWPEAVHGLTISELRDLAEASAEAVERTCVFFNLTRELVNAESSRIKSHRFDILSVLNEIQERFTPTFQRAGIDIHIELGGSLPPVLGNSGSASQAIATALRLVQAISAVGDAVVLRACEVGSEIEIAVEAAHSPASAPEAEVKLTLALLRSLLRKQRATLFYESSPFHLQMRFKQAESSMWSHIA